MSSPLHIVIAADSLDTADTLLRACERANLHIADWCVCPHDTAGQHLPARPVDLALVAVDPDSTGARAALRALQGHDPLLPIVLVWPGAAGAADGLAREPGVGACASMANPEDLAGAVGQALAGAADRRPGSPVPESGAPASSDEALRESLARFRSLFTYMEEAFVLLEVVRDANGAIEDFRVLEANTAAEALGSRAVRMYGALPGCSVRDLVPSILPTLAQVFEQIDASDEPLCVKRRAEANGRQLSGYVYRPAPERCAVIFRDVTQEEMLLQENRQQRALLETLIDASPVAIGVVRAGAGVYELANPAYRATTLLGGASLAGRRVTEAYPEAIARRVLDRIEAVSRSGEMASFRTEEAAATPHGEDTYWDVDYVPLLAADGSCPRVLILGHEVTPQVLQRRALAESEARLRAVLDALPVGVYIADAKGRIHTTNRAGREIWGDDMPRPSSPDQYHDDYPAWWAATGEPIAENEWALARALRGGETSLGEEIEVQARDGRRRTILNYALPIRDPEGAITGGVSVNVDISGRRGAERSLERRIAELEVLYYAAQALQESPGSRVLLQRLCDIAVESAGLQMAWVGLVTDAPEVPSGLEATAVGSAGDYPHEMEDLQERVNRDMRRRPALQALESGLPVVVADLAADTDADPDWLCDELAKGHRSVGAFPLVIDRQVAGVLVVYADEVDALGPERVQSLRSLAYLASAALEKARLFEQVNAYAQTLEERVVERTEALVASERRFRAIYEGAAFGVLLLDPDGRVLAANPASQDLLRYSAEDLRRRTFVELLAPGARARAFASEYGAYVRCEAGGRPRQWEVRFHRSDGETRWGEATVTCVYDSEGEGQFAILMLEDVTEERAARAALIEAERLQVVAQLSAALAHEIKNPLQGALGALGLLREALPPDGSGEPYIDAASEGLWRVDRVVARLGEVHQQRGSEERRPTDLGELVEQTLLLTERQRLQCHVHTVLELPADLPRPVLAPGLIQRVLLNLVLNAYEAMPGGGTLTIRGHATSDREGVSIEVEDTGVGIPPEALAHVFDFAYPRGPQSPRLGLFGTREIVRGHCGRISVESEVGAGTTFTIWLPL